MEISTPPFAAPPKASAKDTATLRPENKPSIAQFALNQMLNASNAHTPLTSGQGKSATMEFTPRSLSIYRDADSGQYVAIKRDQSGKIIEQLPDDRVLEFYARLEQELQVMLQGKENPADVLSVDVQT